MSILSAGTTNSTALNITADTSGSLILASNNNVTAVTVDANQNATFASSVNAPNTFGFKNRIMNGGMVIDQRNAGASVTPADGAYTLDRWFVYQVVASKFSLQQNAGSVTPPVGFSNYLGVTSLSAYTVLSNGYNTIAQVIEGFNTADLQWGTANAKTVTLSFQVYSSLTGTFGGAIQNSAANRSYPFTYTISSANTWTSISVTIAGDTSGTWVGATNGKGMVVFFGLGVGSSYSTTAGAWAGGQYFAPTGAVSVVGTNGATFYITGVQLETGTKATSFDYRDYGRELALCQRYYYRVKANSGGAGLFGVGWCRSTTEASVSIPYPTAMRTNPTALEQSGTAANYQLVFAASAAALSAVPVFGGETTTQGTRIDTTVASGLTAGQGVGLRAGSTSAYLAWSAEL
jgi:hypothetical protein